MSFMYMRSLSMTIFLIIFFFFFFQAEDGIRDGRVTGVQTCALPIWEPGGHIGRDEPACHRVEQILVGRERPGRRRATLEHRSEERRVGKECRSRWWT